MSVRLSACVNLCISQETHVEISRFLYMLPVAVARLSSNPTLQYAMYFWFRRWRHVFM